MTTSNTTKPLAIILGGSTGIGKETAKRLIQRGTDLILLSRNVDNLESTKTELKSNGIVETVSVDLSDINQVDGFIARIKFEERPISFLVNAAGSFSPKPFLQHKRADYDKYMDVIGASFLSHKPWRRT